MRILNSVISLSLLLSMPIYSMQKTKLTKQEQVELVVAKEEIAKIQKEKEGAKSKCNPEIARGIVSVITTLTKGAVTILSIVLPAVLKR